MYTTCTPGTRRDQKRVSIPWNWSYRRVWANPWVLGIKRRNKVLCVFWVSLCSDKSSASIFFQSFTHLLFSTVFFPEQNFWKWMKLDSFFHRPQLWHFIKKKTSSANKRSPTALRWGLTLYQGLWLLCSCFVGAKHLRLCLGLAFHMWIVWFSCFAPVEKQTKKLLALLHGPVSELCLLYAPFPQSWLLLLSCVWWAECTALLCLKALLVALRSLPSPQKLYDQLLTSMKWLTWVLIEIALTQ